ncbi:hypothetical protein [Lysinibacillus fusiformis]|uniref:hypothetical protein n=1 Tax=Lysinibacillus fusiformis TaxID=28031 RepID=UPI0011A5F3D2|nr:hypothetical protein [Lysinibacillus fusiformis]
MKNEQLKIIDYLKNKQGQAINMQKNKLIDEQAIKDFLFTECSTKQEAENLLYDRSEELYVLRVFLENKGLTAEAERFLDMSVRKMRQEHFTDTQSNRKSKGLNNPILEYAHRPVNNEKVNNG